MIDADSLEFMAFADELMNNEEFYNEFRLECKRKFQNYISHNPEEIRKALRAKLIKGSIEHGAPSKYTQEQVDKELEMEFLDIFGWSLVGLYCKKKQDEQANTDSQRE